MTLRSDGHAMKPFRIAHFADLHLAAPLDGPGCVFDKRIVGFLNSRLSRGKKFNRSLVRPAAERILAARPDVIVFAGDASTCGQPVEFELALDMLSPLVNSGIPILFSPGNHDIYTESVPCRKALDEFLRKLTNGLLSLEKYPCAFTLGPLRFLCFNAAHPTAPWMSSGTFNAESQALLEKECAEKCAPLVAVCHFPVRKIRPGLVEGFRHKMFGAEHAAELLTEKKLDLVLCGHIHRAYRETTPDGRGETSCGSLTRFGSFQTVDYADGRFSFGTICV